MVCLGGVWVGRLIKEGIVMSRWRRAFEREGGVVYYSIATALHWVSKRLSLLGALEFDFWSS